MWVMHPEQTHLKCQLDFHSSCSQSPCCAGKRRTHTVQAVSFKCTQHGSARRKAVKWGVFLLFCVVYSPWNRSDEELLQALPGEAGWDWTAPDRTAGAVFRRYARWRKVMAAQHTYLNPKLASARARGHVQRVWSLVLPQHFWSVRCSCGHPTSGGEMYCDVDFAQRKAQLLSTLFKALKHKHFEGEDCSIDVG